MLFRSCYACDCGWTFRLWNTSFNTSLTLICCTAVQATFHICIASDHFIHLMHQRIRSNRIIASAVKADVICDEARLFSYKWCEDTTIRSHVMRPGAFLRPDSWCWCSYTTCMATQRSRSTFILLENNEIYMRLPIYELCKKALNVFAWQCLSSISYIWCMVTAIWLHVWCSYVS
jgi:hypothetical protein